MKTWMKLDNFPEDLLEELKAIWLEGVWTKELEASKNAMFHHCLREDHPVFAKFPKETRTLEYYSNPPHTSNGPHLDRGRWSAMNIPIDICLLYTSPSPRDRTRSRMPSSA